MKQRPRIYYTQEQKTLMWDRWQAGDSLHEIARLFDRGHSSIQGIFSETGGIRPRPRKRSPRALSLAEREEISRGMGAGRSLRSFATTLGRSPSTVSREIRRNGGRRHYRASKADAAAWDRARRAKPCKLVKNRALARIVARKLRGLWSPEQIAGWLKYRYPDDESYQARGALKKELLQHLRRTRKMRRGRGHTQKTDTHGRITGTVSIRERPASVEDRAVPGHWEGDLLIGSNNSQIATLVERHTRYVMLVRVPSKDTKTVINMLISYPGNSTNHSPGIAARRWPITSASVWILTLRFTSAIRAAPGNVARTRTPMAC